MFIKYITCILFSIVWSVTAKGEILINDRLEKFGEDLALLCKMDDCCSNNTIRWHGGPDQKLLMRHTGESTNRTKYTTGIQKDGFFLIIKNLSERDLNVMYECSYGFVRDEVNLTDNIVFKDMHTTNGKENLQDNINSALIGGIVGGVTSVLAVIGIFVTVLYCIRKRHLAAEHMNTVRYNPAEAEALHVDHQDQHQDPDETSVLMTQVHSTQIQETNTADLPEIQSSGYSTSNVTPTSSNEEVHITECKATDSIDTTTVMNCDSTDGVLCTEPHPNNISMPVTTDHNTEYNSTDLTESTTEKNGACGTLCSEPGQDETDKKRIERGFQFTTKDEATIKEAKGRPKHSEYANDNLRKRSFTTWSKPPFEPSIETMASAGFFYSGYKMHAKCFYCGKGRYWGKDDDPFDENFHKNCEYLKKS